VNGSHVEIGALVRYAAAIRSPLIARHVPLVAMALPHIGHAAIRNRGTIGGSIAFADPAAELPACLLALGGEVTIAGAAGTRIVAADDFFRGLFDTALEADELLTGIRLPVATAEMRYGFAELSRRHGDYAIVGLAASARMAGAGLEGVRLAFFGIGATPVRSRAAEIALGKGVSNEHLETAVAALADDLEPSDDIHARAKTRLHLAGVLLKRVVAQMLGQTS
jgi:carbon-monoxide dehydrogenase medium subunit